jgi:hypothetical protein
MPLRGGVCLGKAIMNKAANTFVGEALVEASELEKNQRWIGATLGSVFVKRLDYGAFVDSLPAERGVSFDLAASGVVMKAAKTDVEFIDVFNCDPAEELPEGESGIVVIA